MTLFDRIMRATPKIMTGVAVLFYLGSVITALAAGQEIFLLGRGDLPAVLKARTFVLVFVQPMVPALLLLFGAALLWRIDLWLRRGGEGVGE